MLSMVYYIYWPFVCLLWRHACLIPHILLAVVLFLLVLGCRSSLYVLDINHLSYMWLANIFSHLVDCLFTLLIVSFHEQKFLKISMKYNLSICCGGGGCCICSLPNPMLWRFSPTFSSKCFVVLPFTFRSLIHFELIFVYGVR